MHQKKEQFLKLNHKLVSAAEALIVLSEEIKEDTMQPKISTLANIANDIAKSLLKLSADFEMLLSRECL